MSVKKITTDMVRKNCLQRNIEFLDDTYINGAFKHNCKCLVCSHIWKIRTSNIQQGQTCPKCSIVKRKKNKEDVTQLFADHGIEFLDDFYKDIKYKHNVKCMTCDLSWKIAYKHVANEHGCPQCANNVKRQDIEIIKKKCFVRNIELLSDVYLNAQSKYKFKCVQCEEQWITVYNAIQQGSGCPKCAGSLRQKTMIEKYGSPWPSQNLEIALKIARSSNRSQTLYHWLTNEELICTASYEIKTVQYLNDNKINFKWQPEVFPLSTGRTYRPDLHLTDEDKWIEIKGYMRQLSLEKWNEFQIIKPNSELWDTKKLQKMGIIK